MIYRVTIIWAYGEHGGSTFFATKREADRYAQAMREDIGQGVEHVEVETAKAPRTKRDLVDLLNVWATHPDNG